MFGNKTVDGITSNLKTMVTKLENLTKAKVAEAEEHIANSDLYKSLSAEAHEEAAKAQHVVGKIKDLLGID